jgi:sulfotransferase
LQNIIAQNRDFYATPTSGALDLVYGARVSYTTAAEFKAQDSELMRKAFLAFSRGGLESYYRSLTDKPYILDKGRGWGIHFDLMAMIFDQDPKIICMVRDLRQILASMEKKFRQNPDKTRAIENHNNVTGTTTLKRMMIHLQTAPVGIALDRLAEIHHRGWSKKFLFIRYEDLTTQPKQAMERIYSYLDVPYFEHDFDNVEQVTHEDDQVHGTPGLHTIRPRVEPLANDYMSILGRDAVRFIQNNYPWFFTLFGYQASPL